MKAEMLFSNFEVPSTDVTRLPEPRVRQKRSRRFDTKNRERVQRNLFDELLTPDDDEYIEPWSYDEIEEVRFYLLKKSVNVFDDDRAEFISKLDSLNWVFRDDDGPFGFLTCCRVEGYDYHTVRYEVLSKVFKDPYLNFLAKMLLNEEHWSEVVYRV